MLGFYRGIFIRGEGYGGRSRRKNETDPIYRLNNVQYSEPVRSG